MNIACLLLALFCAPAAFCYPFASLESSLNCVDPTVACQDLRSAHQCGVVSSCIHDVWSTMSAPDDDEDICAVCKEMVKEARDQLLSNMTQEELKEVFEGSCKLLPIVLVQDACIKLVDQFIPQLVEMLASRMDPNMVCTVSGFCNVLHIPEPVSNVKDDLECQFCTHVLEHVKQLITANTTVEEFRDALLNFCNKTSSFAAKCSELVDEYFDTIFGFIRTLDTKSFCTLIGLCGNQRAIRQHYPMVKVVPAIDMRKRIPMMKLSPAVARSGKKNILQPLIKVHPSIAMMKKKQNDMESNDIFSTSNQLPGERLNPPYISEEDLNCPFCKAISFYLKEDLKGDRSKRSVEDALNNVCSKWVKEFPDQCKAVVSKYSIALKHRIVEGASFDDICFFAKACPLEKDTGNLNVRVMPHTNSSPFCDLCKDAFNTLENKLKDPSTKKSVEDLLNQACNYLPSELHDECTNVIDQNLNTVFNVLEQELTADNMCPLLKLCSQPGQPKCTKKQNINDMKCDVCKTIIGVVDNQLKDPAFKQYIQESLNNVCELLPETFQEDCKKNVDENIDGIISDLISVMDPTSLCTAMQVCSESPNKLKILKNDIECDFCKEIIQKVDDELKDQRTEEAIKEALTKACDYLPASMSVKCERFVRQYSTLLISLLAQEMDPQLICAALNLCPDSSLKKPEVKGIECDICKEIVQQLDDELKDKRTEDEIEAALKRVCSLLPSSITDKCNQFIDTYAEVLLSLMAAEMTPTMVCGALNICAESAEDLQQWKFKAQNLECEGCQYFLHYVQNSLMDTNSQKKLKNLMKRVCKLFPETYDDNCEAYIDEYGSSLLTILAQEIDPSQLCFEMSACGSNVSAINKKLKPVKATSQLDECSLCKSVVEYIDKLLEEDDIDKEITALVEKVCSAVPGSLKAQCSTLVETYGPYILQMIGQMADSNQVCQAIDMCPRTRGHVHLLGGEKCTFGPSYWCQSKSHAAACKAEMFCKQKVWSD